MSTKRIAVVTGASSGIGLATTQELERRGFHVLAGVRKQGDADRLASENVEPVLVDITDEAQLAALTDRVAISTSISSGTSRSCKRCCLP